MILQLLLSMKSVMFVVLTICGHRHVPFPARAKDITTENPAWLYLGFTSYEQTEWLRNTLLVKGVSCLVSQSESVGRRAVMTLPVENSADAEKAVCGNMHVPFLSFSHPFTACFFSLFSSEADAGWRACAWSESLGQCFSPSYVPLVCLGGRCGRIIDGSSSNCLGSCIDNDRCSSCMSNYNCGWCAKRGITGEGQCFEGGLHGKSFKCLR